MISDDQATDLFIIQNKLKEAFQKHVPPLQVRKDNDNVFEVAGTREAMQGKQKVDGFYFGSVVPKPKDVRFYYFPIYTHADDFNWISEPLRKCLKGKSCFHIKKMDEELYEDITAMIKKGVEVYLKDELI